MSIYVINIFKESQQQFYISLEISNTFFPIFSTVHCWKHKTLISYRFRDPHSHTPIWNTTALTAVKGAQYFQSVSHIRGFDRGKGLYVWNHIYLEGWGVVGLDTIFLSVSVVLMEVKVYMFEIILIWKGAGWWEWMKSKWFSCGTSLNMLVEMTLFETKFRLI